MKTSWDLTPLFQSNTDPQIDIEREKVLKVNQHFVNKWKNRDDYLSKPQILKKALDEYENLLRFYGTSGRTGYYFWLKSSQDQTNPNLKADLIKTNDLSVKLQNELQFFEHRLAKVNQEKQKEFLESKHLALYKHFLEKIFKQSKYLLSEPEEKIINLKMEPSYSKWAQMTSSLLSKEERETLTENGKKEKKNLEQLISLTTSKNKTVRDEAAKAMNDILRKNVEIAEAEINAILENKKVDDNLRKMSRPDLSRHLSDDIETEVVDTVISAVSKRYEISNKFYAFKAKLLGVKKLEYHERNVEYGKIDKSYSYREAADLVLDVFKKLDPKFSDIFSGFLKSGQVDVYPKKGKRGGAFCAYWLITQPTFILLNFNNKLRDVTTLAHELGHGINNELMKQKQNALNFGTPTSTAEVASTFMEDFVLQEILKGSDDETKLGVMLAKLNDDISTIFRQIACYTFETELHQKYREKGYLSHQEIGQIFQKHMSSYMGKKVEQSKGSENWWIYWSHIRSFFYVYSYASGLIISKSLQNNVKTNPEFIVKVKEFLASGLSASPKNIFKNLGIDIADINFWNKGLDEIEELLNKTINLAKKLQKI